MELQDNLINQILDDMDIKTMMALLYDVMDKNYDKYSVDELIADGNTICVGGLSNNNQVTDIEFDFVDSEGDFNDIQAEIVDDVLGIVWEADDDEDLVEEVSSDRFCVKSIDYRHAQVTQTGRLPNQLARWHRVTPIPADPVPIMVSYQTQHT